MAIVISHADWLAAAQERYGKHAKDWRFVCAACGHPQSAKDFADAGVDPKKIPDTLGISCVGRWLPAPRDAFDKGPGPCNYAGYGLFRISPIHVVIEGQDEPVYVFDFADRPLAAQRAEAVTA
jgi:hypothetical protein